MTESKTEAIVVVSSELTETSLLFLDTLKIRETATYLYMDGSHVEHIRRYVQQGDLVNAHTYVERSEHDGLIPKLVFIPGHVGDLKADSSWIAVIRSLYREGVEVFATVLAASGILKESVASSASLALDDNYRDLAAGWRGDEIVRDRFFWTANDSATTLSSLAYLYKADSKGGIPAQFPVHAFEERGEHDSPSVPMPSATPAADIARMIAQHSRAETKQFVDPVANFALRLALEGHVASCNAVIQSLLAVFPNLYTTLGAHGVMPLECVWRSAGERPMLPWEVAPEELDTWDRDRRENYRIPSGEEDRLDLLESFKVRVSLGRDRLLYPYTTPGAIVMAVEAGWVNEARQWMAMLVQGAMVQDFLWPSQVGACRTLVDFALTGVVAEITGHTATQAEQDASTIKQALLDFPETSAVVEKQQRATAQRFAEAPWPALVRMLDIFKLEGIYETIIRPPASPSAIREAEQRLGVELPSDYKDFLLISNGTNDLSIDVPGFKRVEDLCWESPDDLGLDWVRVTLGCEVDLAEEEQLPSMKRVLTISEPGEEMMWYVEPDTVAEAIQALKGLGRSDESVGEREWRPVFFLHWAPELQWYKNFRVYIESVAQQAEKAGAQLDV
ncbi:uncharacterized protein B0H18DRAFT_1027083 [Fomitopsis serialis]|uniref:uncharacterized protein n=1 Tax=Fomitopsis serialis TaxID=139415 RepID=UPI002007D98F|nr:uncharacterized protein B0H18DRAFT_1027083 [Neoantrodia serialis]KAH9919603.1 hypothetical protein B0H18DRAFT_1027083 [Neoantrodia serialis]